MQIPIIEGVYSKVGPDFERSYPLNLVPNVEETGVSKGYLRSAPGITQTTVGYGPDGGGIFWNDVLYRISGTKLVKVLEDGTVAVLVTLGGTDHGTFTFSFDRLAVCRNTQLWYIDVADVVTQVTDIDLGPVIDVVWMDGYFVTTDGTSIVVTELLDPTSVDPLKYGSSEEDPDDILGLLKIHGELVALNRNTIEFFDNTGTTGFPFERNRGAEIQKGIVGTWAKAAYLDTFAFVGSGRGEKPRVYLAGQGTALPISDRTLDNALALLTDDELSTILVEAKIGESRNDLFVHLPDITWVYSHESSVALQQHVWYKLASGTAGEDPYPARNFVLAYNNEWHCGHTSSTPLGKIDTTTDNLFGDKAVWQFDAAMVYTGGGGAVCHDLELVGHFGRAAPGVEPRIFMSWTNDGLEYSQQRAIRSGFSGQRQLRVAWRRNGFIRQWRSFRFRGITGTPVSFSRLEAELEPLGG